MRISLQLFPTSKLDFFAGSVNTNICFEIADVLNFARSKFHATHFRISVAAFNVRALRACKKAGFHQVQTFKAQDNREQFIVLMRHI